MHEECVHFFQVAPGWDIAVDGALRVKEFWHTPMNPSRAAHRFTAARTALGRIKRCA